MYEKNTYRLYPIMNSNVRSMHGGAIRSEFGLSFTILLRARIINIISQKVFFFSHSMKHLFTESTCKSFPTHTLKFPYSQ